MSQPKPMTVERLRHLQRVMFGASDRKFDIATLGNPKADLKETQKKRLSSAECVSACCMLGYAGFDPWMRSEGLRSVVTGFDSMSGPWIDIEYGRLIDELAGKEFFGLNTSDNAILFGFDEVEGCDRKKPTKRDAILNIERVIRGLAPLLYSNDGIAALREWGKENVDLDDVREKAFNLSVRT